LSDSWQSVPAARGPLAAINRLEDERSELFGCKVDLVSKRTLHRLLRDRVLAEARTIYAA
jgi:predicted nucleotidyltransferase